MRESLGPCVDHGQRGNKDGYGHSGPMRLHRKVFLQSNGYLPEVVMHMCDNPRCINPEHLAPGTWADNNKDRAAKGRSARRADTRRKLDDEAAAEVRRRWSLRKLPRDPVNGVSRIARDFGVDTGTIYNIVKGKSHFA